MTMDMSHTKEAIIAYDELLIHTLETIWGIILRRQCQICFQEITRNEDFGHRWGNSFSSFIR